MWMGGLSRRWSTSVGCTTSMYFYGPIMALTDDAIGKEEDGKGYQILHWNGAETTYWVVSGSE